MNAANYVQNVIDCAPLPERLLSPIHTVPLIVHVHNNIRLPVPRKFAMCSVRPAEEKTVFINLWIRPGPYRLGHHDITSNRTIYAGIETHEKFSAVDVRTYTRPGSNGNSEMLTITSHPLHAYRNWGFCHPIFCRIIKKKLSFVQQKWRQNWNYQTNYLHKKNLTFFQMGGGEEAHTTHTVSNCNHLCTMAASETAQKRKKNQTCRYIASQKNSVLFSVCSFFSHILLCARAFSDNLCIVLFFGEKKYKYFTKTHGKNIILLFYFYANNDIF
jgi:hypothetical protein